MPWCDDCSKFWSPNSLPPSGACPTCGRTLHVPAAGGSAGSEVAEDYKAPWHFKLMIVLAVVYLTWRFIQLITWIV